MKAKLLKLLEPIQFAMHKISKWHKTRGYFNENCQVMRDLKFIFYYFAIVYNIQRAAAAAIALLL